MPRDLYERCPSCDGTLLTGVPVMIDCAVYTGPLPVGSRCPCTTGPTPGFAPVGLTAGQVDRLVTADRERRAEVARLRSALEPFAEFGEAIRLLNATFPPERRAPLTSHLYSAGHDEAGTTLTYGHCVAALEALEATAPRS